MWHYFWGHMTYHLVRWLPRNNRIKISVVLFVMTLCILVPQLYVLVQEQSARFCGQHLFELLIVSIIFTFCLAGFTFLFSIMLPVPREVKMAFHIFGVITLIEGLVLIGMTAQADECKTSTEELYYISVAFAVVTGISIVFFLIAIPFWIINKVWPQSVLDPHMRTGMCFEPVKCCSCIWHI